jgi:cytoskeletal protein RodZ
MKFGDRLRQAREARGLALDAIVKETHIARHYLEALERSDLEPLPGVVFNKGYIRSYAQVVGIDPEPILMAYQVAERQHGRVTPESDRRLLQKLSFQAGRRGGSRTRRTLLSSGVGIAIAAFALALLVGGGWFLHANRADVDEPDSAASSRRSSVPESVPPSGIPSPVIDTSTTGPSAVDPTTPRTDSKSPPAEQIVPEPVLSGGEPDGSQLAVSEAGLGTGIVERTLVGQNDRFSEGTRVFFWTRVVGGVKGVVLRHIWETGGEVVMNSELVVGGPHWRTYSSHTLPPGSAGTWTVEARGPDGRVLARREFACFSSPDLETRRRDQRYAMTPPGPTPPAGYTGTVRR